MSFEGRSIADQLRDLGLINRLAAATLGPEYFSEEARPPLEQVDEDAPREYGAGHEEISPTYAEQWRKPQGPG
jgi:hypothetical protein